MTELINALGLKGRELQFLSKVLELSQVAVVITDPSGLIEYVNPAFETTTGYKSAEVHGKNPRILKSGRQSQEVYDGLWRTITSGRTWSGRMQNRRKDGSLYWETTSISPLCGDYGRILHFIAVMGNLAGEMKVEREYRMLFEGMLEGFALHEIICDSSGKPVDYRFLIVNPAFEQMTGLRAADVVGRTAREIMPEMEPMGIERYGDVALTGKPAQFEERNGALGREFHVTAYRPEPGKFAAVFTDITERKSAEARIALLTRLYSALSQCNQAIVHSATAAELLPAICRNVVEFGGMKMAWIGMADAASGMIRPVASFGSGVEYLEGIQISTDAGQPSGRGPVGTSIRENRPDWSQDFQSDPGTEPWRERGSLYGWRAVAGLPLRVGGKTAGALGVYCDKPHAFDEEVRRLLEELAGDIGFALDSFAREAARRQIESIMEIRLRLVEISGTHSLEELLVATLDETEALTGSLVGFYHFLEEDQKTLSLQAWSTRTGREMCKAEGKGRHYDVIEAGVWVDCIHEKHPVIHNDYASLPHCKGLPPGHAPITREMVVPVFRNDRIVAILGVGNKPDNYTDDDVRNVSKLADIAWDICERKRAQEALLEKERRYRALLENLSAGVVVHAPDSAIVLTNSMASTLLGLTEDQMTGKTAADPDWRFLREDGTTLPPDEYPVRQVLDSGEPLRSRVFGINRPDLAEPVWVMCNAYPERDASGTLLQVVVTFTDVSERKSFETSLHDAVLRAEVAARAKSDFLAVMSHELRTPLNGVLGFAELLSETTLDREQLAYATTIRDSGIHLLNVVNDILDFSSLEKGSVTIESGVVPIAELLESACLPIQKFALEKGLAFRCETLPGVPGQITGDIRRLRQILINLLGNAVKFTSTGSVALRVAPAPSGDGRALDFSVEDTGPGIPSEMIGHLFEPFVQANSKLCRPFEGNGLGLAISQRLACVMGGTITVASTPGKGSTFTFRLPFDGGPPPAPLNAGNPTIPPARLPQQTGGLILLVEDDRVSSLLAAKILSDLGYETVRAADGYEAIQTFVPGKFSAVLMDMQMPVMDGIEATQKIRETEAGAESRVPIIALTANVMPGDRERCLAAGMDDFLSKPFKKEALAALLARLCG